MRVRGVVVLAVGGFVVGVVGPPFWQAVAACVGLGVGVLVCEYRAG